MPCKIVPPKDGTWEHLSTGPHARLVKNWVLIPWGCVSLHAAASEKARSQESPRLPERF